ncbi:hypothetical protein PSTT_12309, partial [Puccinia striiformis]
VCTCTACIKQTITTPNGEAIPGSWVHPSTRRRHWAQNSTPQDNHRIPPVSALPSIPPPNETSPASEPDSEPAKTLSEAESIRHIYYFIAWLSLVCGVSQANCRIARDWIIFIIKIFQKLPRDRTEYLESYKDSRTITKHLGLDPEIESSICCTKCFSLYEHEDAPTICAYRRSKKAQVCGEGLFKTNADKLLPGYQPVSLIRQRYPPPFKPFTPCLVYHTAEMVSEQVANTSRYSMVRTQPLTLLGSCEKRCTRCHAQLAFEPEPSKHLTHDDQLDDWEDDKSSDSQTSLHFQDNALAHIRKALPDIIIPRGVTQVPLNLGDPKHGKLKASEWHSLFSTYLPLSLINFFVDNPAKCATDNNQICYSFSSLVICTNIVSLKSINDSDSNKLAEAYSLYTETSKLVFDSPKILPNHHYALHLPEQMKWWGLSRMCPIPGERVNGILQKMKTNGIIGQIEGTVLREFCQIQRLNSQAPRWSLKIDNNECDNKSQAKPSRLVQVHPDIYMAILQKLQSEDPTLRHYQDLPHPDGSRVVTPYANEEDTFKSTSGLYISKTKQNRLVAYQKDGHTRYAWVTHVYSLPDFNNRILVAVKALADACTGDAINIGQSFLQTLNDLGLKVVQENPNRELLDPGQVIAVCAYRHLPAWTFRYHLPLVVLRQMPHDLSHLLFPSSTQ